MGQIKSLDCNCEQQIDQHPQQNTLYFQSKLNNLQSSNNNNNSRSNEQNQGQICLIIKIIGSSTLELDKVLRITPQGIDGYRGVQDGYVLFGSKKKNQSGKFGLVINDVVIPSIDKQMGRQHRGIHFYICYEDGYYYIKDEGIGFGTFKKINNQIILKNNMLLNMGLLFIVINTSYGGYQQLQQNIEFQNANCISLIHLIFIFLQKIKELEIIYYIDCADGFIQYDYYQFMNYLNINQQEYMAFLQLSFQAGYSNQEKYLFCSNMVQKDFLQYLQKNLQKLYKNQSRGTITIGRDTSNLISYSQDNLLSKHQCNVKFDGQMGWILEELQSKNGVWIYIDEKTKINDGMIFKANHSIFQVQYFYD